ncbi:MAG: hypothetical protein ABW170_17360 [Candidatus Thiodiazotropha sp. L084R]
MSELQQSIDNEQCVEDSHRGTWSLQSLLSLPILLRATGSLVLLTAMSLFLFQHWDSGDDLHRYWMLLGFNALLALSGFAIGRLLGEAKGARTFLILALAAVPINFSVMGAFIYAGYPLDGLSIQYPQFASWQISENISLALPLIVGALLALMVSWLGFLVLARDAAPRLTIISLLANAALLIPIRDNANIAWLILALAPALIYSTVQIARNIPVMRTFEGRIAQLLLLLPIGLIIGRALWFYPADSFLYLAITLVAWWGLRILGQHYSNHKVLIQRIEWISLILAPMIALLITDMGISRLELMNGSALHLFAYSLALLYFERAFLGIDSSGKFRMAASFILAITAFSVLIMDGGTNNALFSIANGILVMTISYMMRNRLLLLMGAIALLTGIGYQLWYAIEFFNIGGWGSLAVIGSLTIVTGSLVEKFSARLKLSLHGWSEQIRNW